MLRLEPALDRARAEHPPCLDRVGQALERNTPEIVVVEEAARQASRALGDHHLPRLGQRFEPGGKVWRVADDAALLRVAAADEVADHHEPGRDPDPHL